MHRAGEGLAPRLVRWLAICLFALPAQAKYGGGTGEPNNPYLIYTAEQMNEVGLHKEDWQKHFKLLADIDLGAYTGTDFNIIGYGEGWWGSTDDKDPFTGVFDGNGRTISNFRYSSATEQSYIGIFGYVERAKLQNLRLVNPSINVEGGTYIGSLVGVSLYTTIGGCYVEGGTVSGGSEVAGLVGFNCGIVAECASSATVSGYAGIGGLVGYNNYGSIGNCYSSGSVSGTASVGGLVGYCSFQATIAHCYSAGKVQGAEHVGGLLGFTHEGDILSCFWDVETSGQISSAGGIGKTTAEMQTASTFAGWGCYAVWIIREGLDYPRLRWENVPGEALTTPSFPSLQGSGTEDDPYLIYTAEQFGEIGLFPCEWDKHFKLMADIDLSGYAWTTSNTIGRYVRYPSQGVRPFVGVFDGNGKTIRNFGHTSAPGGGYAGIFADVEGAEIKGLGLIDPNVSFNVGGARVGSLAAWLHNSTITNCYVEGGSVSGGGTVGGLIGENYDSTVDGCHVRCSLSGGGRVGGLVGWNRGAVRGCQMSGQVSATGGQVGGLAGDNSGTISKSTSSASVSGAKRVGGLVGTQRGGRIIDCYATGSVLGTDEVGGLVGGNNGTIANCYTTADVSGVTYVGGFAGQNGLNLVDVAWHGYIYDCYATGSVVGQMWVAGLVGYNDSSGTICNSYSTGTVSGVTHIGGLVGQNRKGEVISSFWDIETSGQTSSAGGTDKTTAEMKTPTTFLDARWDFVGESENGTENIWTICEGVDYPHLAWEFVIGDFDGDADTDFADFCIFAARWLENDSGFWCGGGGADLTHDGRVDLNDLREFAEHWLGRPAQ